MKPRRPQLWVIPAGTVPRKCHGCPEMIFDVQSPSDPGKTMPLSVMPTISTKAGVLFTNAFMPNSDKDGLGFSHFANCPAAESFRKGRK